MLCGINGMGEETVMCRSSLSRGVFLAMALFGTAAAAAEPALETPVATRRYSVHVVGGLVNTSGAYGGLGLVGIEMPSGERSVLRLGVEAGALLGSGRGVPVLASFVLRSDELTRGVSPFLGVSIGPVFCSGGGAFGTGDEIKLGLFLRAGARFPLGSRFDAMPELWLGGLTGVFLMAPALKLAFYL